MEATLREKLPRNWPKDWATKVWNVGGTQVLEADVAKAYLEIAAGRQPRLPARMQDRVTALLKRPGFIRWSKGKWEVNA